MTQAHNERTLALAYLDNACAAVAHATALPDLAPSGVKVHLVGHQHGAQLVATLAAELHWIAFFRFDSDLHSWGRASKEDFRSPLGNHTPGWGDASRGTQTGHFLSLDQSKVLSFLCTVDIKSLAVLCSAASA